MGANSNHDRAMADYLRFHQPRFDYVMELLTPIIRPGMRLLDIGWSALTDRIHDRFGIDVDALGFDSDSSIRTGRYYHFDLNDCQRPDACRTDLPIYDVILFAEVLEHLHTSPNLVLNWLVQWLKPRGHLILQTPNAVALPRRLAIVMGRNPFERIRDDASNPGHFREYTRRELEQYLNNVGLDVIGCECRSYFDYRFARHGEPQTLPRKSVAMLKNLAYPWLPPNLRPGLTCIARRAA